MSQKKSDILYACSLIVLAHSIPRFKVLGLRNLQYEIRICQKSHNTVTNSQLNFMCGYNFYETDATTNTKMFNYVWKF